MSDDLDKLRDAMARATPAPDPDRKAATLRLTQKNFDDLQGSAADPRPTPDRPQTGRILDGVKAMIDRLTPRGALAATTALVAVGVFLALPDNMMQMRDTSGLTSVVDELGTRDNLEQRAPAEEQLARRSASDADLAVSEPAPAPLPQVARPQVEAEPMAESLADQSFMGEVAVGQDFRERAQSDSMIAPPVSRKIATADPQVVPESDTEAFANADTNPLKSVTEEPVSTFSIDVDTASYAVVRSSLTAGAMPPPAAVRIEEMVNYFPYSYAAPEGDEAFATTATVLATPWNPDTQLVHIGLQGAMPALEDRPPLNLVFLIDTSGSMHDANKLPLLKQSLRMMLAELRPEDQVAIVTYAGSAGRVLDPTPASDERAIFAALERLQAGGSTAGQAGLQQAYATAEEMADDGEVTRVLLATDGDFNVGLSDPEALKDFIAEKRETGVYLSVLGFGRGNLDDATMQALAQNGNGQAAYIDTLNEARKVLVDQLTGALFPIANDVKIQVEFNPATIAEYRLIGYETRALRREDFNNDRIDAGEIGAGHRVTAIYEVTPVGSPATRIEPLRYGSPDVTVADGSDEIGFLRLRYKTPGESRSQLIETPILPGSDDANDDSIGSDDIRFSAAIAGFGQLLRDDQYLGDWGYADAIALATGARGDDSFGYRAEAINLMRLAETLDRN
ncbi:MAG: VWA domain-containing protein [Alphaproteobacteria bacterium]|nr:VWA domain-containing protein [Alphaproteobacteria bacterium]